MPALPPVTTTVRAPRDIDHHIPRADRCSAVPTAGRPASAGPGPGLAWVEMILKVSPRDSADASARAARALPVVAGLAVLTGAVIMLVALVAAPGSWLRGYVSEAG